jgi:hypothetical protein
VREGNKNSFNYTHKVQEKIKGQLTNKMRIITAGEYIELMSQQRTDMRPLDSTRLCIIDDGLYIIVDWYDNLPG